MKISVQFNLQAKLNIDEMLNFNHFNREVLLCSQGMSADCIFFAFQCPLQFFTIQFRHQVLSCRLQSQKIVNNPLDHARMFLQ